jgi:murein DD-endopeptidase MepM/ murein hydrolase activator NlpD
MKSVRRDIDLGMDPPIDETGSERPYATTRAASPRWMIATLLGGAAGAGLMAFAIVGTLEEHRQTVQPMQAVRAVLSNPAENLIQTAALTRTLQPVSRPAGADLDREDRLVRSLDIALAKRTFRAPATVKVGDREVLQSRVYTRVSTPLETASSSGRKLPSFNPALLISESNQNKKFGTASVSLDPNADVSFSTTHFNGSSVEFSDDQLDAAGVAAQAAAATEADDIDVAPSPISLLEKVAGLDSTSDATVELSSLAGTPFTRLEVKLVTENYAELGKIAEDDLAVRYVERVITLRRGGNLAEALTRLDVNKDEAKAAAKALAESTKNSPIIDGDRLKITFANSSKSEASLVKLALYSTEGIRATIGQRDDGDFESIPLVEPLETDKKKRSGDKLSVFASIYETVLAQNVPRTLADELVRVYSYDVDFQSAASASDMLDFFYAEPEDGSEEKGELLYAAITVDGDRKEFYRYRDAEDGSVDFYDPQGRSGRKFLLRMPLPAGELRSGFGWRRHPILGYMKMHTGVDWSNRVGTPILAAGNGVIRRAAWDSGYGRRVEIEHANGYITTYSHMSGFGPDIAEGIRVRQGQVIGYLGSSGLSTGPHLHYEVIVNDNFLDPMAIKLPRGKELQGAELASFKQEMGRVKQLLQRSESTIMADASMREE